ncbi:MAG: UDP-3-O-acyl-N-acetylglucosamine deacetylase [bacterium]|jgi:UDP-3-O-acyl N-acetylglucosamine deacetylase
MPNQTTIVRAARFEGRGLFSDLPASVVFHPAPPNTGVVFRRIDLGEDAAIRVHPDNLVESPNCSVLANGKAEVSVVEHVLACLAGLGIDNVFIDVDGPEIPSESGSAGDYLDALAEAGKTEQDAPARSKKLGVPLVVSGEDKALILLPADTFSVSYVLDHAHPLLGVQYQPDTPKDRVLDEILRARTFITEDEAKKALDAGFLRHENPDRAVLITGAGPNKPLLAANEPARHKAQDILGDLSIFSPHLVARVIGIRSGHHLNHVAAKRLAMLLP